jgi:hypothetical protein
VRNKALDMAIDHIRSEDANTNHIDIGPVNKTLNMLSIWFAEGSDSANFKKHVARIDDYLWLAADGMKMQVRVDELRLGSDLIRPTGLQWLATLGHGIFRSGDHRNGSWLGLSDLFEEGVQLHRRGSGSRERSQHGEILPSYVLEKHLLEDVTFYARHLQRSLAFQHARPRLADRGLHGRGPPCCSAASLVQLLPAAGGDPLF